MAVYITVRPGGWYEHAQLPHIGINPDGTEAVWTHPNGMKFKSTMTERGRVWKYTDEPVRPAELDVPHWAQGVVASKRASHGFSSNVTDRMIFATLMQCRIDDQPMFDLAEWDRAQQPARDHSKPWLPSQRSNIDKTEPPVFDPARQALGPNAHPDTWPKPPVRPMLDGVTPPKPTQGANWEHPVTKLHYVAVPIGDGYQWAAAPPARQMIRGVYVPDHTMHVDGDYWEHPNGGKYMLFGQTWMLWNEKHPLYVKPSINGITQADVDDFRQPSSGNKLDAYQRIATKSAIYPGKGTPLGLIYVALKANGEAGELAEHVGKAMRDDHYVTLVTPENSVTGQHSIRLEQLTPERHNALKKEAGDLLWYLSAICNELGETFSTIAAENLQKLADRTAKGTLQGSGDNR